jgi:catechol 2,3-dioxygenase-like lactoylglutathione lyase family enzyme
VRASRAVSLRVKGLQHLNLTVADLGRARDFYAALGFELAFAKGDTVWLSAGGDLLGLSEGEPPRDRGFEHFGFIVDERGDVDRWALELAARGVAAEKGPYDRSDGRSVYFRDPDGHLVEIFWLDPAFLASSRR